MNVYTVYTFTFSVPVHNYIYVCVQELGTNVSACKVYMYTVHVSTQVILFAISVCVHVSVQQTCLFHLKCISKLCYRTGDGKSRLAEGFVEAEDWVDLAE